MDRDAAIVCYAAGLALAVAGIALGWRTGVSHLEFSIVGAGLLAIAYGYIYGRQDEGPPEGERSGNAAMYLSYLPGAGLLYAGRGLAGCGLLASLAVTVASLLVADLRGPAGTVLLLSVVYTIGYLIAVSMIATRHEVRIRHLHLDRLQWMSIRDYRMLCLILTFGMMFLGTAFWIAALALGDLPLAAAMLLVSVVPAIVCWRRRESIPVYTDDGNPDGSSDPNVFRCRRIVMGDVPSSRSSSSMNPAAKRG